MASCQVRKIPGEIQSMDKLRSFNIAKNQLVALPNEVGELTALEELVLKENNLKEVPSTMVNLQQLQVLDLAGNHHFNALPDFLASLAPTLQALHVSNINLNEIPEWIGDFVELREFTARDNVLISRVPCASCFLLHNRSGTYFVL